MKTTQALALGLGSMFNHSRSQNVGFRRDVENQTLVFSTLRDVEAQEELCISYGSKLWFDDADNRKQQEDKEAESEILNRIDIS